MADPIEPDKTAKAPIRAAVYVRMSRVQPPNPRSAQIDLIREYAVRRKNEVVVKDSGAVGRGLGQSL